VVLHGNDSQGESNQPTSLALYSSLQFASTSLYPSPREWRPDLGSFFLPFKRERDYRDRCIHTLR